MIKGDTRLLSLLRRCATFRKVAASIPDGVTVAHCGCRVDSASNRNEHQEYLLGVKRAGA